VTTVRTLFAPTKQALIKAEFGSVVKESERKAKTFNFWKVAGSPLKVTIDTGFAFD